MGQIAVPVPETNTLVPLGALENLLMSVALWDLDTTGAIQVRRAAQRGQFQIERGDPTVEAVGLQGALLDGVPVDRAGIDLRQLVMDRWVSDDIMALNALVIEVQAEAMDLGIIHRPDLPHLIPGLFGHHTFPPVQVNKWRLARERRRFKPVAAQWAKASENGTLWADLLRSCGSILYYARPQVRFPM